MKQKKITKKILASLLTGILMLSNVGFTYQNSNENSTSVITNEVITTEEKNNESEVNDEKVENQNINTDKNPNKSEELTQKEPNTSQENDETTQDNVENPNNNNNIQNNTDNPQTEQENNKTNDKQNDNENIKEETDKPTNEEMDKPNINEDTFIPTEEINPPKENDNVIDTQPTIPTIPKDEENKEEIDLSNAKLFDVEANKYVDLSELNLVENDGNMVMPLLEPNYTHFVYNGGALRLDIGKPLFGYHQTNEFYVYQGNQKTVAYCFQTNKHNPSEGNYPAVDIKGIAPVWKRVIGRILQYAPGTLGYANNRAKIQSWFDNKLPYNYPISGNSKEDTDDILSHIALSIAYAQGNTNVASKWGNPWVSVANEWLYYIDSTEGRKEFPDVCPYNGYSYRPMILQTGNSNTQDVGFLVLKPNDGYLKLNKSSSDPTLTNNNDCYSLKGAEYGVYSNAQCTTKVATLTTDMNGNTNTVKLKTGNYWVREDKAPKGYFRDNKKYPITITNNHTSTAPALLKVKDIPKMDPVGVLLRKVDSKTKQSKASVPTASLEGAEFTFKFYKGIHSTDPALQGQQPVRTWVFKTDNRGIVRFAKEYKVSGDEFWYDLTGLPSLPIGTITIQETKSPEGYLLNDEVFTVPIKEDFTAGNVFPYVEPVIPETLFSLKLIKKQSDKDIVIPNTVFEHTSPDGVIDEYTTDENGQLSIEGLQYGVHTIKEKIAPNGYLPNPTEVQFRVNQDNSIEIISNNSTDKTGNIIIKDDPNDFTITVEDKVIPPSLKIIKENDKSQLLQGAEFTLYTDEQCTQVVDKAISNEQGQLQFKNIDIDKYYWIMETKPPKGYKLPVDKNNDFIKYKIKFESIPSQNKFNFIVNDKVYNITTSDNMFFVENNIGIMKVINATRILLPNTGSNDNLIFVLTGSVLMLSTLIIFNKKGVYKNEK